MYYLLKQNYSCQCGWVKLLLHINLLLSTGHLKADHGFVARKQIGKKLCIYKVVSTIYFRIISDGLSAVTITTLRAHRHMFF